jgi:hypothetical protein
MFNKLISVKLPGLIGHFRLRTLFSDLAKNQKSVRRFSIDAETYVLTEDKGSLDIIRRQPDGIVVKANNAYLAMDAHYHPDGDLKLSLRDKKTLHESRLPGIIVYSDNGEYTIHLNTNQLLSKEIQPDEYVYGYCNVCNLASDGGRTLRGIIGEDNAKNGKIVAQLDDELQEIQNAMKEFCGYDQPEDADNITNNIKKWVNDNISDYLGDQYDINDLSINDHVISHGIENFIAKGYKPEEYITNIREFAQCICSWILSGDDIYEFGIDDDLIAFENAIIAEIEVNLTKGDEASFINKFSGLVRKTQKKADRIREQLMNDSISSSSSDGGKHNNFQNNSGKKSSSL